jgi:hypothetical protein
MTQAPPQAPPDVDALLAELRADPEAVGRALTNLFLFGAGLAIVVADHTGAPEWRAVVVEIERIVERLRALAPDRAPTGCRLQPPVPVRPRSRRRGRLRRPWQA